MNPKPIIAVGSGSGIVPGRLIGSSRGIANAGSRLMNLVGSTTPPATPTGLSAVGGTGSIALTCDSMAGATSYDWQYSSDGGSTYSALTSTGTPSTTDASAIAHMQASSGKVYYKVRATNAGGSSAYSSAVNASPYKAYTLFPQADGTNISGAALEVGGTWTLLDGTADVESHSLTAQTAGADGHVEVVTDVAAGVTIKAVIGSIIDGQDCGLLLRLTDLSNYYLVYFSYTILGPVFTFSLYKQVAGSYTQLATTTFALPTFPATVNASFVGNVLTADINGAHALTATDAFQNTATKHGYRLGFGAAPPNGNSSSFKVTSP